MNAEEKSTVQSAIFKIRELRHVNEILNAKVEVLEIFARAFGITRNYGAEVDIVWQLERLLEEEQR